MASNTSPLPTLGSQAKKVKRQNKEWKKRGNIEGHTFFDPNKPIDAMRGSAARATLSEQGEKLLPKNCFSDESLLTGDGGMTGGGMGFGSEICCSGYPEYTKLDGL
eukprot:1330525-Amorphochlora_amoeboformis.AAC.1